MNNFWSLIIIGFLFALFITRLHAGSPIFKEFKTKPIQWLDDELKREFSKPNRWGYFVVIPAHLSRTGYTHSISLLIDLIDMRLKSISEIEKIHATIYGDVLSKINSIKNIRPFLANFPLSPASFTLSIGFVDHSGGFFSPPYFVSIIMSCGVLEFNQFIKDKLPVPFETVLTKPIDDSEGLQKYYNCKVERKASKEKPNVPKVSYLLNYNRPYPYAIFEFSKVIIAKNNLNYVDLMPIESQFKDPTPFNLIFWGTARLTKDAARKLAAECAGEFLQFVQNDKRTLDYMDERSKNKYRHDTATFPEARHIGFRISFWDENMDRQIEPYIAEIRLHEGKLRYFTADDGQRLVQVHEETFDEGQAFLKSLSNTSMP